jgi:bifunctional non-homologous end joining protein LigD
MPASPKEPDGLTRYRDKRDPAKTNEPFGTERTAREHETWGGAFVVHQHGARRMHWDLRLEYGGRLLSFAVPRGPSLDPADKRLAVQTEDHPIEYLDFEDVIPEGNYGAGPMIAWDMGRVSYIEQAAEAGIGKGKLDFLLFGQKLKGRYALVETGKRADHSVETGEKNAQAQRQWLLLKKQDVHCRPGTNVTELEPHSVLSGMTLAELGDKEKLAAELEAEAARLGARKSNRNAAELVPMLCALRGAGLSDADRVYELKLDGVRIIADRRGDNVALRYRSKRPATNSYPEVVRALRALAPERVILDGEIVLFDEHGKPSFQALGPRIHAERPHDVKRAVALGPVSFIVFDLLQLGDYDLCNVPLYQRKALLKRLLPGRGIMWVLDHIERDGRVLYEWCKREGLEGLVAKRADGVYRPGPKRTTDWVKLKVEREDEFVVVGWLKGNNSRERLGALELGSWDGSQWLYRGRAGSGIGDSDIPGLLAELEPLRRADNPAVGEPLERGGECVFVEPRLVVRVSYLEWTPEGRLRHAVFRGVRHDKDPRECRAAPSGRRALGEAEDGTDEELLLADAAPDSDTEAELDAGAGDRADDGPPRAGAPVVAGSDTHPGTARASRVKQSNRSKIFWPEEGYTKGDLLDYYAAISDTLLPYLKDRPVILVRYPDGIDGKSFYQWNVPRGTPDWVQTLALRDEEHDGKNVATFLVDSVDALLHIVNLGCIPLHVLASRQQTLQHCDFLTIDFDLGGQPFKLAVQLSLALKELLDSLSLPGFPKTSGQSGLHVLVPLGPGVPFASAKMLCELLGRLIEIKFSEVATMERRVAERRGRVYIDTGQTGRLRSIVAPYSARAYAGGTVSTPLHWDEVHLALDPRQHTMLSVPQRVLERGDPMRGLLLARPDIAKASAKLGELLGPLKG